jgi:hypothetical protein
METNRKMWTCEPEPEKTKKSKKPETTRLVSTSTALVNPDDPIRSYYFKVILYLVNESQFLILYTLITCSCGQNHNLKYIFCLVNESQTEILQISILNFFSRHLFT